MSDKVSVRVVAWQKVCYDQTREISREDFERLEKGLQSEDDDEINRAIEMDYGDICDAQDIDWSESAVWLLDENGKKVREL